MTNQKEREAWKIAQQVRETLLSYNLHYEESQDAEHNINLLDEIRNDLAELETKLEEIREILQAREEEQS